MMISIGEVCYFIFEMLNLSSFPSRMDREGESGRSIEALTSDFGENKELGDCWDEMRAVMGKKEDAKWISEKAKGYFNQGFN